ncbi:hypothetical protein O3X23_16170 [Streptomyces sp. H39-S7]|nr:hypothetical protein [Streptomyces sp. H39-S7]MCZ4120896.1 hypothetical protein [Streptomyces sp. H39-S7]
MIATRVPPLAISIDVLTLELPALIRASADRRTASPGSAPEPSAAAPSPAQPVSTVIPHTNPTAAAAVTQRLRRITIARYPLGIPPPASSD